MIIKITALLFLINFAYCVNYDMQLPDLGDIDRSTLPDYEAKILGKSVIKQINDKHEFIDDYDIKYYLNDLGNSLVSSSSFRGSDFEFYLIANKQINAFALPGNFICVFLGLFNFVDNEAELVAVLSHEIGHIIGHHITRNIANQNRNQRLALVGLLAGGLLIPISPQIAFVTLQGVPAIGVQNMLSFSRDLEIEADRIGQRIMEYSSYNTKSMPDFFIKLKERDKYNDNEALEFLRTHPVTSLRINEALERVSNNDIINKNSINFLLVKEKIRNLYLNNHAFDYYLPILKNKKNNIDILYFGLSLAYLNKQNFSKSLDVLALIHESNIALNPIVLSQKGLILVNMQRFKEARKIYTDSLKLYPNYFGLEIGYVNLFFNMKQYQIAENLLDKLLFKYPNEVVLYNLQINLFSDRMLNKPKEYFYALGNKHSLEGDCKLAVENYRKALKTKNNKNSILNAIISAKILECQ